MIRLTFLLRRRSDLTLAEFQDYWLNEHGPLVTGFADAFNTLRYVQVHTLESNANQRLADARGGSMELPYDGVAELWWRNEAELDASTRTAAGRQAGAALIADEANFLDPINSSVYLGYEYPQINPAQPVIATPDSGLTKVYFPLRSTLDDDVAQAYWHQSHGPLIRSLAATSGLAKYMQVHRSEHPLAQVFRNSRGIISKPYLGHAEVWIRNTRVDADAARAAAARAVVDERQFIDFEQSAIWLAHEHVLVDREL